MVKPSTSILNPKPQTLQAGKEIAQNMLADLGEAAGREVSNLNFESLV